MCVCVCVCVCVWVRGERACYRLEKPAACYLEVSRVEEKKLLCQYLYSCAGNASKLRLLAIILQVSRLSENKLRIGDLLKSQLLKTPKVNFILLFLLEVQRIRPSPSSSVYLLY